MVSAGVLEEQMQESNHIWSIKSEALRISDGVVQMRCTECSHNASIASSEKTLLREKGAGK